MYEQQIHMKEKEELTKCIEQLKTEKKELQEKISGLHENMQELSNNFKETRWALTSEVAEKHDQVQELRRCVSALEEQLRQADMQTLFKDDIIKELRKELKSSRKPTSSSDVSKKPPRDHSPPVQLINLNPLNVSVPEKNARNDEVKLDIHIFPISESDGKSTGSKRAEKCHVSSVEVQTDPCRSSSSSSRVRNVSTQHKTHVQKLPRSFGTLTVKPWSGAVGEISYDDAGLQYLKDARKNLRGIYTVPCSEVLKE